MRVLTYVLGAVAGFFTFGGIGLIIKGYKNENNEGIYTTCFKSD